jgi:hypothetical protein
MYRREKDRRIKQEYELKERVYAIGKEDGSAN